MNFLNPYSRNDYKDFFQNKLLSDDFEFIEEKLSLEFKPTHLTQVVLLGRDKSLELDVYEISHLSENDPRVGLSKEIFRLMSKYGTKRALAILHSPNSKNYRLSLATVELSLEDSKIKREYSNPRRYSFYLGPDAKVHTPNDFLIKKGKVKDFDDLQNRFSIEVVNKEFYKEIANWYFWALYKVKFPDDAEVEKNGRNTSVIRLITRLIFIWFMKVRKLIPEELFNENTLKDILADFKTNNDNYYKAILQNLFFATLNTKQNDRRFTSKKRGYKGFSNDFGNHNVYRYEEAFINSEETIEKFFLTIPFLNGGLFECLDYKTKLKEERKYIDGFTSTKSQQPSVPNFLFFNDDKLFDLNKEYGTTNKQYVVRGLLNTLSLYNFTIDEIDPNDSDVALDPELLGKVFENLLASYNPDTANTARKSTGSFYTPRLIVDFMVDESLKQYFKTHINLDDIDSKLEILFSNQDSTNPFDKSTTVHLVSLIDSLRVVDPAVGSGAFPMRLLNRLVFLLHKLDPANNLWKESQIDGVRKSVKDPIIQKQLIEQIHKKFSDKNPDYGRKLYLIEKCIYGVDIQQIAVEIAKLRFFISLLVDEKVDFNKKDENYGIEPLPNLDFKLMQGNSLISSFAGIDFNSQADSKSVLFEFEGDYKKSVTEFEELKSQHQNESDVNIKKHLKAKIDEHFLQLFREKLKLQYPQLKELERKYSSIKNENQRLEILLVEKKKLFKKIGIDLNQAEQDLIAYTEGRKQKDFFLWDVYFAEVFAEKGGFDIVIGNPPYGAKLSNLSLLKQIFINSSFGNIDSYKYFIDKGVRLINYRGCLSYIASDSYLEKEYYSDIRKLLLENSQIIKNVKLGDDIFENVQLPTAILQVYKFGDKIGVFTNDISNISSVEKTNSMANTFVQVYPTEMNDYAFVSNSNSIRFPEAPKLIDLYDQVMGVKVYQIGKGKPKQTKYEFENDVFVSNNQKDKKWFKFIESGVKRYYLEKNDKYIKYGPCLAEPREEKYFFNPKILIREVVNPRVFACYVAEDSVVKNTMAVIVQKHKAYDLKYLLALINSKLFNFYIFQKSPKRDNKLFPSITSNLVKNFPVVFPHNKTHKIIIDLVNNILSLKGKYNFADIEKMDDQIDIMVYKVYNLNYEEIKTIDPEIEKIVSQQDYEKMEI